MRTLLGLLFMMVVALLLSPKKGRAFVVIIMVGVMVLMSVMAILVYVVGALS